MIPQQALITSITEVTSDQRQTNYQKSIDNFQIESSKFQMQFLTDRQQKLQTKAQSLEHLKNQYFNDLILLQHKIPHSLEQIDFTGAHSSKSSRNPADIFKITLDAIALYFSLRMRPIQINSRVYVTRQICVPFWKDSFEQSGKYIMGPQFDFMKNLKNFNKDSLNDETMELLEPLLGPEGEIWFHQRNAQKKSKAIMYLNRWLYAIRDYHNKSKEIKQIIRQEDIIKSQLKQIQIQMNQLLCKNVQTNEKQINN